MRASNRQIAMKLETSAGVAQDTFAAADIYYRMRESSSISLDPQLIDSEEDQASSEKRPSDIGRIGMPYSSEYRLKGPGDLATDPAVSLAWGAGMLAKSRIKTITIGAPAGGPFVDGETITGDGTSGTGRVFRDTSAGGEILYSVIAGTIGTAEEITGGTSGATATTSTAATDFGALFMTADSDFGAADPDHHLTMEYYIDGRSYTSRGTLGELSFAFQNGQPVICNQDFLGVLHEFVDRSLIANVTYPEETVKPPRWFNTNLLFDAFLPRDIVEMTLSLPLNLTLREDANDTNADGVRFTDYKKDHPTITIAPGNVTEATYAYLLKHSAGTTFAVTWTLGTLAGSTYDFYADECQFVAVGVDAREDLATTPLEIQLSGTESRSSLMIHQH